MMVSANDRPARNRATNASSVQLPSGPAGVRFGGTYSSVGSASLGCGPPPENSGTITPAVGQAAILTLSTIESDWLAKLVLHLTETSTNSTVGFE